MIKWECVQLQFVMTEKNINKTRINGPLMVESEEEVFIKVKEESEKSRVKTQHSKI